MNENENAVIQKMHDALSEFIYTVCPVKTSCFFCGVHDACKKARELYRETEELLNENRGET